MITASPLNRQLREIETLRKPLISAMIFRKLACHCLQCKLYILLGKLGRSDWIQTGESAAHYGVLTILGSGPQKSVFFGKH